MKKVLSLVLAVLMVCAMLPLTLPITAQAGGRTLWLVELDGTVHEVNEEEPQGPGWSCEGEVLTLDGFTGRALFGFCSGLRIKGENKLSGVYINGMYGANPTTVSGTGSLTVTFDAEQLDCSKYNWGEYYPEYTTAIPKAYYDHAFTFDCQYGDGQPECHMTIPNTMKATGGTSNGQAEPLVVADKSHDGMIVELLETEDGQAVSYVRIEPEEAPDTSTPTQEPTAEPTQTPPPPEKPYIFEDVKISDWFYDEVQYAAKNGLMKGRGERSFAPKENTTRAELVVILHRLEGEPAPSTDINFSDIKAGWYYDAVLWAAENGIVNGYSDGSFRPNRAVSREEFAIIMEHYARFRGIYTGAHAPAGDAGGGLNDTYFDTGDISSSAYDSMNWAVAEGLIAGVKSADGKMYLQPKGKANRAQTAAILMRLCENVLPNVEELSYNVPLEINGRAVLNIAVPASWKDQVQVVLNEDVGVESWPAKYKLQFFDKLNSEYGGLLFSVALLRDEWVGSGSIKYWNSIIDIDSLTYDVVFSYPTDVQFGSNKEEQDSYLSKYALRDQIRLHGVTLGEGVVIPFVE